MYSRTSLTIAILLLHVVTAEAVTIGFGSANADLPYTEDGVTFRTISGLGIIRGTQDFHLSTGGTFTGELRIRAEAQIPFELQGLEIERLNQPWRIETSAGGLFEIPAVGILDLGGRPGFANISHFDLVNNGGVVNASLYIDDVRLAFVPEPNFSVLLVAALLLTSLSRTFFRRPASP